MRLDVRLPQRVGPSLSRQGSRLPRLPRLAAGSPSADGPDKVSRGPHGLQNTSPRRRPGAALGTSRSRFVVLGYSRRSASLQPVSGQEPDARPMSQPDQDQDQDRQLTDVLGCFQAVYLERHSIAGGGLSWLTAKGDSGSLPISSRPVLTKGLNLTTLPQEPQPVNRKIRKNVFFFVSSRRSGGRRARGLGDEAVVDQQTSRTEHVEARRVLDVSPMRPQHSRSPTRRLCHGGMGVFLSPRAARADRGLGDKAVVDQQLR